MRPLHIDFAKPGQVRILAGTSKGGWILLVFGMGLCIALATKVAALNTLQDTQRTQLASVNRALTEKLNRSPEVAKFELSEAKAKAINAVVLQLNLPWRDLLDAVEQATPANVALLAIEPDAKKQLLKGAVETRSSAEMIAYIESLKKQDVFESVVLTKHETNDLDVNKPLRFQFEAQWTQARP